jgi:hypothetical protein
MKFQRFVATAGWLVVCLCTVSAGQEAAAPGRTFELYSWKVKDTWHYSLVEGTNQVKTYDQITAGGRLARGTHETEELLGNLTRGDQVNWMSSAPRGIARPQDRPLVDFKHPSRERIKHFMSYCRKKGIKLTLR